jgi:Transposase
VICQFRYEIFGKHLTIIHPVKILGIDIGNGSAVCCLLEELPSEPRKFIRDRERFITAEANKKGLETLLGLKPDIAVMEPSGVNYCKVWANQLAAHGIEVRLVSHRGCNHHRETLDMPDKEDETDAFVLAHYTLLHLDNRQKFLRVRDWTITRMREIVLRLEHLSRAENPIVNRLRQELAWQFPEMAQRQTRLAGEIAPLFFRWLCDRGKSKRLDALYKETIGLGIQETTRLHAARMCDFYEEEIELERELQELMKDERFRPYIKVFTKIGIGLRISGIILSQIYPFEDFLGEDGKPIQEWHSPRQETIKNRIARGWPKSEANKKVIKHISLRRFEKMIGVAPTERSSGQEKKKKIGGGASLCRKSLWRWIFTRVETVGYKLKKGKTIKNPIDIDLYNWMNEESRQGKPIKIRRMKVASKITRILFNELVNELGK